jgi:peptide/nickel transport system substrate-binding protein
MGTLARNRTLPFVAALAIVTSAGCGYAAALDATPAAAGTVQCMPGGVLTIARDQEPESLNPDMGTTNGTIFVQMQIFERLVEQAPGSDGPVPGVAESWEISPDGLSYTFHLRTDRFSNGDPVTAEDVKFSLDRFINPEVNVNYGFLAANVRDVEIVDPSTIRINMKSPDASILTSLTLMSASILPQAIVTQLGEEAFGEAPIGSGPFMLERWDRGQDLRLVRNPNYWKQGQPYLDGVTFKLVADANARVLQAQSGEADIVTAIPTTQVGTIEGLSGYRLESVQVFAQDNVWLNHRWSVDGSAPFGDKRVRQALNYATTKEAIINVIFNGVGTIANTMGSPTQSWDQSIPPYPHDLDKAKGLMAQSTLPAGFTLPMLVPSGDPQALQTAELLRSEWAKIGINVDIQPLDSAARQRKHQALDYGATLINATAVTSDTPDDGEIASIMFDYSAGFESFWTGYDDPTIAKLVREAASVTDAAQREALYVQLQKTVMDEAPSVPLVLLPTLTAVSTRIGGFETLRAGHWLLQDACFLP